MDHNYDNEMPALPDVVLGVDEGGRHALVGPRLPVGEAVADGAQEQQVRVTVTGQGLHFVPSLRWGRVELIQPFMGSHSY